MAQGDHGLHKWLLNVVSTDTMFFDSFWITLSQHKFGFSFVSGVPATPEATEELSQKIGFIRETQCSSLPEMNLRIDETHSLLQTENSGTSLLIYRKATQPTPHLH
jgi:hypothetical protein